MPSIARKLRKSLTDAEMRLWSRMKNRALGGFKFRRQHPLPPYVVDFVCLEQRLAVELDGGQHVDRAREDTERTAWLESQGFRVIRFWNDEVLRNTDGVLEEILQRLSAPHPRPLPAHGARE